MPTARPRITVTKTGEVARVLDDAARRCPGVSRSELIRRILVDWAAGGRRPAAHVDARWALVGSLPGSSSLYGRGEDWPA